MSNFHVPMHNGYLPLPTYLTTCMTLPAYVVAVTTLLPFSKRCTSLTTTRRPASLEAEFHDNRALPPFAVVA